MKTRFHLYRRGEIYYAEDSLTRKQASLRTRDLGEAQTLLHAKNEASRQSVLNLRLAQTYLSAADPEMVTRTWQEVMDEFVRNKTGKNRSRSERATKEAAFDLLRARPLLETRAEHFLRVLEDGSVSTNSYLRRFHNFALGLNWLPWPVLAKRQWPAIRHQEKRAITREEHAAIIGRERNVEHRAFYELCWHLGGSQSDVANLKAEDVNWETRVVSFFRAKTGTVQIVHFGTELEAVLRALPSEGPLFPKLMAMDEKHRGSLFQRACRRVKVQGVSLHCYRYSWAERAKVAGYPERFAQMALGHTSKAVHRAYAKKAHVILPALEDFEKREQTGNSLPSVAPLMTDAANCSSF